MISARGSAAPRCAVFDVCGGCGRQDQSSAAQLLEKQTLLQEQLRDTGGFAPGSYQLLPPVTGPQWSYRRKARLAARWVRRKGCVLVGFREKRGSFVTVMDDCEVLAPGLAELIRPLRVLLNGLEARAAIPQIEVAAGEAPGHPFRPQAALVLRHLRPLASADLARLSAFAARWKLQLYLQPAGIDSAYLLYPRRGLDRLYYHLPDFGLRLAFHPLDFLQVNAAINRRAVGLVVELLELQAEDRVLDLFCGLGNFSLPLATRCAWVTGVEGDAAMVARAEENARANGLQNTEFFTADLYRWNTEAPWAALPFNKVVLDPPRGGALETIPLIASSRVSKLVYVSCNPATLARDARELIRRGFHLKSAGLMDMFPHTLHSEAVALFERPEMQSAGQS